MSTPILFTAGDLARWCGVDLVSVHNWTARRVAKGKDPKLPYQLTGGGQLRFKAADVRAFLVSLRIDVPEEVSTTVLFEQVDAIEGPNHNNRNALMLRNGRWGTCVGCPRTEDGAFPERCQDTDRGDHQLSVSPAAAALFVAHRAAFPQKVRAATEPRAEKEENQ